MLGPVNSPANFNAMRLSPAGPMSASLGTDSCSLVLVGRVNLEFPLSPVQVDGDSGMVSDLAKPRGRARQGQPSTGQRSGVAAYSVRSSIDFAVLGGRSAMPASGRLRLALDVPCGADVGATPHP